MAMVTTQQYFTCPITHNIMNDPYVDNEGNSYEKVAIEQWLLNNNTSPITRSHLSISNLKPNRSLKEAIEAFLNTNVTTSVLPQVNDKLFKCEENPIKVIKSVIKNDDNTIVNVSIVPNKGKIEVPNDIVVVVDVSGSMSSPAYIEQNKKHIDVGFTILDITKHSIKTIIESLNTNDRISIVTFSDVAKVICGMTEVTNFNKTYLKSLVNNLKTEGCTNIWSGLNLGLKQFSVNNNSHNKSLMFMTDGIPSSHLLPPRGIIDSLNKAMKSQENCPTIYTFGFGYSLDTKLLSDIANIGNGTFAFIPDSGFVGTVVIHAMANIKTVCATNAKLKIITNNEIKKIHGYKNDSLIDLNTINYGQNKDIVIVLESNSNCNIELEYYSYNNNLVTLSSVSYEFTYNTDDTVMRLEFVDLLNNIIQTMPNVNDSSKLINLFTNKYNNDSYIINDINEQVKLAISNNTIYNKWGKNYIYSLMYAHKEQKCNNFKDKSVSVYGGELFNKIVENIDEIFANMDTPIPSVVVNNCDVSPKGMNGTIGTNNPTIDFSQSFHNASGGCFHGNSNVELNSNNFKKCKDIEKGDIVKTDEKNTAKVVCVTKIKCHNNKCEMVSIGSDLIITPYHPIKKKNWVFPNSLNKSNIVECDYMYNFVLDNNHTIMIGNNICATLGHGITTNDVIKHSYYGTQKVITDLVSFKGYNKGLITFDSNCIIRDNKNNVIAFDLNKEFL
tara:strand:+ start:2006 stop:4180 length:2175 start_codon:yes stop_codon:yes gene_type:complete